MTAVLAYPDGLILSNKFCKHLHSHLNAETDKPHVYLLSTLIVIYRKCLPESSLNWFFNEFSILYTTNNCLLF